MVRKEIALALLVVLLVGALVLATLPAPALAHHYGQNPGYGNINDGMVHTGLMENAVDQTFDNRPDNDHRASDGKIQTMDGGQSQVQDGHSR